MVAAWLYGKHGRTEREMQTRRLGGADLTDGPCRAGVGASTSVQEGVPVPAAAHLWWREMPSAGAGVEDSPGTPVVCSWGVLWVDGGSRAGG